MKPNCEGQISNLKDLFKNLYVVQCTMYKLLIINNYKMLWVHPPKVLLLFPSFPGFATFPGFSQRIAKKM